MMQKTIYLIPYHRAIVSLAKNFHGYYIDYVPQKDIMHVDALASLVATLALPLKVGQKVFVAS